VLNEGDIKAAVIDRLFKSEALDNAVLINEMVIANWSRRADLVVANGKLHAYEIKSDLDSLRRLRGQLETYLARFDKVTVVSTPRFIHEIQELADPRVEIWSTEETADGVTTKIVRRGLCVNVQNKKILCGYLLKTELVSLLASKGIDADTDMARGNLESAAEDLPVAVIRRFVLSSLKIRYKATFEVFCDQRKGATKPQDISSLSRPQRRELSTPVLPQLARPVDPATISPINLQVLAEKYGPLPVDMPQFVLKRA